MSAPDQARLLVQLRAMRLSRTQRALIAARAAAEQAEAEARTAASEAAAADLRLADDRLVLAHDLNAASARLALVDRSIFLQSVAKSAANDAAEHRRLADQAEQEQRRAMVLAQARHDRIADHARMIAVRAAAAAEERLAIEAEETRSRR
jgi:hypothetical protein